MKSSLTLVKLELAKDENSRPNLPCTLAERSRFCSCPFTATDPLNKNCSVEGLNFSSVSIQYMEICKLWELISRRIFLKTIVMIPPK